jgi:hypothetical protein
VCELVFKFFTVDCRRLSPFFRVLFLWPCQALFSSPQTSNGNGCIHPAHKCCVLSTRSCWAAIRRLSTVVDSHLTNSHSRHLDYGWLWVLCVHPTTGDSVGVNITMCDVNCNLVCTPRPRTVDTILSSVTIDYCRRLSLFTVLTQSLTCSGAHHRERPPLSMIMAV